LALSPVFKNKALLWIGWFDGRSRRLVKLEIGGSVSLDKRVLPMPFIRKFYGIKDG
jgi:hypothetical protein